MAIKPINWDSLSYDEKLALKAAGETSPLAFTALWFNISQMDSFKSNWHHHYYDWAAQRMLKGESQNNVINIPPGGSKTEFWSIHLPVYCMAMYDRVRILNTSYSKDLVNENSARSRDLIKSSEFSDMYDMTIGKDKVDDWTIERNGKRLHQMFSRSSGGQITGVRGGYMSDGFSGYMTADDWDKMDDLFSEAKRNKSHIRLTNTLRSRRALTTTPFCFIQQRGHVADSTSFLLSGGMGLSIDSHIKIPALIDEDYIKNLPTKELQDRCRRDVCVTDPIDGKWSYWPAKESIKDLVALRDANPYTFTSQYMQDPESLDGGIFSESDFVYYGDVDQGADIPKPDNFEYRFITADTAQKTNTWNDWTVFVHWGVYKGRIYKLDQYRGKVEAKDLRRVFMNFINHCFNQNKVGMSKLRHAIVEDKSSGTGLIQEVKSLSPVPIKPLQRNTDKLTRAMDVAGHHAYGKVALALNDPTNYEFVSEVAAFSADDSHKHDDQTDNMIDALDHVFLSPHTNSTRGIVLPSGR